MLMRLALAIPLLLALQAALVAVASALRPRANVYVTIVLVSAATAPLVVFSEGVWIGLPLGAAGRWYLGLAHLAIGGLFFHFMTLPDRSVTLRILVELLLAPAETLSTGALGRRYGVKTMITSRLEQLAAGRFLEVSADRRIHLTARGRLFGRFVTAGRRLFRIASAN
jgi:hypothetical protein